VILHWDYRIPPLSVIERLCAEAITRAERRLYRKLTSGLDESQRTALDNVLSTRLNTKQSMLAWLRQSPGAANPRNILEHVERLKAIRSIALPEELGRNVHQNHLLRLARQGAQTPANDSARHRVRGAICPGFGVAAFHSVSMVL
jgi:hypothetical protein